MTAARKLQASVGDQLDELRALIDAMTRQMDDMQQRFPASETEPRAVSPTLVMHHAREALKYARGLPAPPVTRQRIQSAYRLVCAELGVDE